MTTARLPLTLAGLIAVALSIIGLLAVGSSAEASTYTVRECHATQGSVNDVRLEGPASGYNLQNSCGAGGSPNYLQAGTSAAVAAGHYRQYAIQAPNGTRMNNVTGFYGQSGHASPEGHSAYMFGRAAGAGNDFFIDRTNGAGGFSANFNLNQAEIGALDRIGVGVTCTRSPEQGNCPQKSGIYYRLGELEFSMEDTVAPATPQTSGAIVSGGWLSGTQGLNLSASDTGAGLSATSTWANGTLIDFAFTCSPDPTLLQPCPSNGSDSGSYDVGATPFTQGINTVRTCAGEYGNNAAVTCKNETVKVDTIAPAAVSSLSVAGGEGWRRDRDDFDLSWSNPSQGANTAPIVGASVRITAPNGYDNTTYYAGVDRGSIADVEVPNLPGDYTAAVTLRDAAGNEAAANASSVHLRFDDTVPVESAPEEANGWLNRGDLVAGYLQEWEKPQPSDIPPSGIAGYRVVVNTNSDTDPCSGAQDQRACGGPITEAGIDNDSRLLNDSALAEGVNFVHVVAVSGSGMRATDVGHTPLRVDTIDPATVLQGDGNGRWINHDANLLAVASDSQSGMQDTDEFPLDDPPATFLEVDWQLSSEPNADVARVLNSEGSHQVRYWARDLAGNTGQPQVASVRIDKSEPEVAFTNSQDPDDPDKLVAPVSDALSGVVDGRISYREAGGTEWKGLETTLRDDNLVARVDSGDLRKGVTYEFRAIATDKAGNARTSTKKANGEPMTVVGPFRAITGVGELKVNGKSAARVAYGKKARVSGDLLTDEGGRPVQNAAVEIMETFAPGSKRKTRSQVVTTNSQGGFSAILGRGPNRTVMAAYKGDRRYLGTSSAPAKLAVRSKITLKLGSSYREDETAVFKGKLKAKGAKLTKRGKRVEIQVRIGKKWKAVGKSFRTNRRGAYKLPYKFTADYEEPITYQFRAVKLREAGFPFLPAKSKTRRVTVSP